jgi:ankyrin repeat protein
MSTGVTPFMAAAGTGHSFNPTRGRYKTDAEAVECMALLKAAGAQVNNKDVQGITALHSAASLGWDGTVKALIADGAEPEALDSKGLTPIDYAIGRHPRAFLEPEHVPHESTANILRTYIVQTTGRQPKEYEGPMNKSTRGTGGASN